MELGRLNQKASNSLLAFVFVCTIMIINLLYGLQKVQEHEYELIVTEYPEYMN